MNYFFLIFLLFSTQLFSMSDQEKKLLVRYPVPEQLHNILNNHRDDIVQSAVFPRKFDWFPGFYVKTDIDRVEGTRILRNCIVKNNCNLFDVTEKYAYQGKNCLYTISKEVEQDKEIWPYSAEHIKQASLIARKTRFLDFHDRDNANLIRSKKKLIFVDTQITGFDFDKSIPLSQALSVLYKHTLSEEAKKQLDKEIEDMKVKS